MNDLSSRTIRTADLLRAVAAIHKLSFEKDKFEPIDNVSDEQFADLIRRIQSDLTIEEALIVVTYFGLNIGKRLSFEEIKSRYSYTGKRVHEILYNALQKLDFQSLYQPLNPLFKNPD